MKENETRIGFMEINHLHIPQWHCPGCNKIFHYADDEDDTLRPKFCPQCGRKNIKK